MTAAKHETVKVDVGLEESAVCMMEIASAPPKWIARTHKTSSPVTSDPDGCSAMTTSSLFALASLAVDAAAAAKKIIRIARLALVVQVEC